MARHTILLALLAALFLLVAHTTATREEKHHQDSSCSKQLESLNLKHCEKHLMKRIQKEEDEDDEDDDNVLMMRGVNYIRNSNEKKKCCSQLSQVNILDCRCEAMKEIMDSLSDKLQKRDMREAEKEVMGLPLRCGIAPPLQCDLRSDD